MAKNIILYGILGALAFMFIATAFTGCSSYNSMIEKQEKVEKSWSQVLNVYQRRMDLIPNLVNTVKGMANFEKSTLTEVANARASVSQIKVDESTFKDPQALQNFLAAQDQLKGSLSRLMMQVEQYPELKSSQGFLQLMEQVEGTENRITVERQKFIDAINEYNTYIRKMPNALFSGMLGFQKIKYFEADKKAQSVPEIKF